MEENINLEMQKQGGVKCLHNLLRKESFAHKYLFYPKIESLNLKFLWFYQKPRNNFIEFLPTENNLKLKKNV